MKTNTIQLLEQTEGVLRAWTYRGRLFMRIASIYEQQVVSMFSQAFVVLERTNTTILLKSTWIDPTAEAKQTNARLAREAKPAHRLFLQNLHNQLGWDSDYSRYTAQGYTNQEWLSEEDEDLLDKPSKSLHTTEGHIGFYYKEDYDLERAQKDESKCRPYGQVPIPTMPE